MYITEDLAAALWAAIVLIIFALNINRQLRAAERRVALLERAVVAMVRGKAKVTDYGDRITIDI